MAVAVVYPIFETHIEFNDAMSDDTIRDMALETVRDTLNLGSKFSVGDLEFKLADDHDIVIEVVRDDPQQRLDRLANSLIGSIQYTAPEELKGKILAVLEAACAIAKEQR